MYCSVPLRDLSVRAKVVPDDEWEGAFSMVNRLPRLFS